MFFSCNIIKYEQTERSDSILHSKPITIIIITMCLHGPFCPHICTCVSLPESILQLQATPGHHPAAPGEAQVFGLCSRAQADDDGEDESEQVVVVAFFKGNYDF